MTWKTLDDFHLNEKRVLVRVDLNVPFVDDQITDATRIERIIPTIRDICASGGIPILLSHLGRPRRQHNPDLSLKKLIPSLETLLSTPITFVADCRGPAVLGTVNASKGGTILLLENTRFYAGEESNDLEFAAELSRIGDIYCNDAFACSHRSHASIDAITRFLPSCAGRLLQSELCALEASLASPKRPLTVIVGGSKISTKFGILSNLIGHTDYLVVGGGMANTILAAQGLSIGASISEPTFIENAKHLLKKAGRTGCNIILPSDIIVACEFSAHSRTKTLPVGNCPHNAMILDFGPESIDRIHAVLESTQTLIWNGPLGAFEIDSFATATIAIAQRAAALTRSGQLLSVAGGGDTIAALRKAGVTEHISYLSTAGGAFLEWLEGKPLPGIVALTRKS